MAKIIDYKTKQRQGKKTAILTIATTPEIKQDLAALAHKWERTLSWTIEKILRDYLDSHR